jgi:hypothetical protein
VRRLGGRQVDAEVTVEDMWREDLGDDQLMRKCLMVAVEDMWREALGDNQLSDNCFILAVEDKL